MPTSRLLVEGHTDSEEGSLATHLLGEQLQELLQDHLACGNDVSMLYLAQRCNNETYWVARKDIHYTWVRPLP